VSDVNDEWPRFASKPGGEARSFVAGQPQSQNGFENQSRLILASMGQASFLTLKPAPHGLLDPTAAPVGPGSLLDPTAAPVGPGSLLDPTAAPVGPGSLGRLTATVTAFFVGMKLASSSPEHPFGTRIARASDFAVALCFVAVQPAVMGGPGKPKRLMTVRLEICACSHSRLGCDA
jgi:hypothetical protein